jgi:hypothetical protein
MFQRTILAVSVAALTWTGVAQAQQNATLTLRSGGRIEGQLVDLGGVGFTVRVNGTEDQIPANDVAVIDFTSGKMRDADWARLSDGQQLLWLKNGDTINGQLYDISGSSPLHITFKTSTGEQQFSSAEIMRIVLALLTSPVATSGTSNLAPATGSGISVSPRQAWTPTGFTVRRGDVLTFNTTGELRLSGSADDVSTPAGSKSGRRAANAPLPDAPAGTLIGRIGTNGRPFEIGNGTSMTMPAAGQLYLGVNDDGFEDNQGEFRVEIRRTGRP